MLFRFSDAFNTCGNQYKARKCFWFFSFLLVLVFLFVLAHSFKDFSLILCNIARWTCDEPGYKGLDVWSNSLFHDKDK